MNIVNKLPLFLFVLALSILLFGYGVVVGVYHVFPYRMIVSGLKTGEVLIANFNKTDVGMFESYAEYPPNLASSSRISFVEEGSLKDSVLFYGGRFQFMEYCPEEGCLAVEYSSSGKVIHAYPYRSKELSKIINSSDPEYEESTFNFSRDAKPTGISRYPNGDLLVVFHYSGTFPFGGGVARINRDGIPIWFRRDYSHHWPTLLNNEIALVPSTLIGTKSIVIDVQGKDKFFFNCETGKPYHDKINILNGEGQLLRQIVLTRMITFSPFNTALLHTTDYCDPLHLNYIDIISDDYHSKRFSQGDFVVSLRNISAFAIIDGTDAHVKALLHGSFVQQHSVHHFEGTKFLMFDNLGGDNDGKPSRLLMVDIENGQETTIFPNQNTPEDLRGLFSSRGGKIDISSDKKRVIVTFSGDSKAVEIRVSDGEVLNIFTSVHDASSVEGLDKEKRSQNAALYYLYGVDYLAETMEGNQR